MKDEAAGEVPVAFVVRSNGYTDLTQDEIKHFISKQVLFLPFNFYMKIHNFWEVRSR